MPKHYLQAILAIAVMIAASYYFSGSAAIGPKVTAQEQAVPKTYLVNPRTSSFDERGALTEVLEAKTATYYHSKTESLLDSPRLYSHNLDGDTWSATSDIGRYEMRRKALTLSNNVILTNDTNQVQLKSQKMIIDFKRNRAISPVPVTITHGQSSTVADSMVANLDAQTVRLKSNVESVYVQPNL
ncbi:MAG: lipopolysaccharide export system protein LptC [Halioglobus sp.]|jgi:LPS export ABC transporter protein LptC